MAIGFGGYGGRGGIYEWEHELRYGGARQTNPHGCARHPSEARSREEYEYLMNYHRPTHMPTYLSGNTSNATPAVNETKPENKLLLLTEIS